MTGAAPLPAALRAACAAVAAGSLLVTAAMICSSPWRIHHDAARCLTAGDVLFQGAVPCVDFFAIHPPLIMYLSAVPIALALVVLDLLGNVAWAPTHLAERAGSSAFMHVELRGASESHRRHVPAGPW